MSDKRWRYALDGLRVHLVAPSPAHLIGSEGEVTGLDRNPLLVWVVLDGDSHPIACAWSEVRPA